MKKLILVLISVLIGLIVFSCKEEITKPEEPPAGRRDYVWDITEIKPGNESLALGRIWGSSPQDVWAIGSSSYTATSIWHFNGMQWRCDSIPRFIQPSAIIGFASNEVWLGNSNSTIWKYDGAKWNKFGDYEMSGYNRLTINYFAGTSGANIYGVGYVELYNANKWKGAIMHYTDSQWEFVNIPDTKVSFESAVIDTKTQILIMSGTDYAQSGFIAKVYIWDGKELKELISELGGWSFVTKLGDEVFAWMNSQIYKYENNRLVLWKDNRNTNINGNIICGRSMNDFFIGSSEGIKHFNGTDFQTIYSTNWAVRRGVVFEKDVFFIGDEYTTGKNYIIHGKLN